MDTVNDTGDDTGDDTSDDHTNDAREDENEIVSFGSSGSSSDSIDGEDSCGGDCNGCTSCCAPQPPSTLTTEDKKKLESIQVTDPGVMSVMKKVGIISQSSQSDVVNVDLLLEVIKALDDDRRDGSVLEVVEEEEEEQEQEDSDGEASSSDVGQEDAPSHTYSRTELKTLSILNDMVIFVGGKYPLSPGMNIQVRKIMNALMDEDEANKERDPGKQYAYNHETSKTTRFLRVSVCVVRTYCDVLCLYCQSHFAPLLFVRIIRITEGPWQV